MKSSRLPQRLTKAPIDSSLAIVNIVLLLIFFFLATGSQVGSQEIYVELPETAELPLDLLPKPLLIIEETGALSLDGETVPAGTLNARLADYPTLHILADRDQTVTAMLDALAAEDLVAVELKLVTIHRRQDQSGGQP